MAPRSAGDPPTSNELRKRVRDLAERKELSETLLKVLERIATTGPAQARGPARELLTLHERACGGDPQAQLALGNVLREGRLGAPKDIRRARLWFAEAARQGNKAAARALAALGGPVGTVRKPASDWGPIQRGSVGLGGAASRRKTQAEREAEAVQTKAMGVVERVRRGGAPTDEDMVAVALAVLAKKD